MGKKCQMNCFCFNGLISLLQGFCLNLGLFGEPVRKMECIGWCPTSWVFSQWKNLFRNLGTDTKFEIDFCVNWQHPSAIPLLLFRSAILDSYWSMIFCSSNQSWLPLNGGSKAFPMRFLIQSLTLPVLLIYNERAFNLPQFIEYSECYSRKIKCSFAQLGERWTICSFCK